MSMPTVPHPGSHDYEYSNRLVLGSTSGQLKFANCIGQEVSRELELWVMVVEYIDRAQGRTVVDFLSKTSLFSSSNLSPVL